ncbi:RluA family pseudouridine synthase [Candidatus Saccharibacteria bacterium]|nr:RluA family pseudouridine synthase [Candidatus Saccharibacteria bacterium]
MRLDAYMAQYWPERSRAQWQKLIADKHVRVNGEFVTKVSFELGEDDEVTVKAPKPPVLDGEIDVIYEDDHVLVMNKAAGILSHAKGIMPDEFTVAEFVRRHLHFTPETNENRAGIVHRLDRETSGVIIAAKDEETVRLLQRQFHDRKAKKTYIAIVRGTPKHHEANIDIPIGRNPKRPSSFRVDPSGKPAQTHYEVLGSRGGMSVVRLRPTTGRTHQLRVHMAYIGAPILGDNLYDGGKSPIDRLCLHAQQLEITIPESQRRTFIAQLPKDFQERIDAICA